LQAALRPLLRRFTYASCTLFGRDKAGVLFRAADDYPAAVALAGDISAEHWLRQYLEQESPVATLGRRVLMPSTKAPQGFKLRGRIVCNCFNVAESEINEVLVRQDPRNHGLPEVCLATLQRNLKCGTNCGSCVPELRRMIKCMGVI
jgi:assimilatory nitrate reductase catalytic subunit